MKVLKVKQKVLDRLTTRLLKKGYKIAIIENEKELKKPFLRKADYIFIKNEKEDNNYNDKR